MALVLGASTCIPPACRMATFRIPGSRTGTVPQTRKCRISILCSANGGGGDDQVEAEYIHPRYPFSNFYNPVDDRPWFIKVRDEMNNLTPMRGLKLATGAAFLYTAAQFLLDKFVFNENLWMYASWTLVFWPWIASIAIAASTSYLAYKKYVKKENLTRRMHLVLLLGSLVWLILVPMGHFQGYLEGYPALMFAVYSVYFILDRNNRLKNFQKIDTGPVEKEWKIPSNVATWAGFVGSIVAGHWLAAFEAPPIMYTWNFQWQTKLAAVMVVVALVFKHFGSHFLYRYSARVDRPNCTVVFGPYRWVRHPIYGSSILLLLGFGLAFRAYGSLALMLAGCLFYYEQVTKVEEDILVRNFGKEYEEYREKVTRKYVPFVY